MRIAIFGSGGVGGYFGARLAQAGRAVVFIARGPHLEAIRRDGLRVESLAGDCVIRPVDVTDAPRSIGQVDVVIVCVKAWQVHEAATAMLSMLGPQTFVLPLQNGVEAAGQIGVVLGIDRVLDGICWIISRLVAPGHVRHTGAVPRLEFGERDGRRTERVERLLAAFEAVTGVAARAREDIEAGLWEKFLFIAPFSGMGALTRMPAQVVRTVPETRAMLRRAIGEVADLARARHVALPGDAVGRALGLVDSLPAGAMSSMQCDLQEGRRSELEWLSGAVMRLARIAGVPAPVNEFIYGSLLPSELRARGALA